MIIIRNLDYIDDDNIAVIDKDEYIEFVQNLTRIQSQAFSSLQYFHKELGLTSDSVFESTAG